MKNNQFNLSVLIFIAFMTFGCGSENTSQNQSSSAKNSEEEVESKPKEEKKSAWESAKVVDEFGDAVKGESA